MADYPKEIKLDNEAKDRLIQYLDTEILNHSGERSEFDNDLVEWQKDYWAKPTLEQKTFPFVGAASLIIPLSAITIEAIHARTMTTLFALEQFTVCKAHSSMFSDITRPLEKILDHELLHNIKVYQPLNDCVLELIKFGTGVIRVGYEKCIKTAVRVLPDGKEEEFQVTYKQGPTVEAIPLARFIMPFAYQDPNHAPWCGVKRESTPYEMRQMEFSGLFREGAYEEVYGHFNTPTETDTERNQQELENREPVMPNKLTWYEVWCSFDVARKRDLTREYGAEAFPPGGEDREIVVLYCQDTRTILSVRYNWNSDLSRPFHKENYFPVEFRWAGIGACKQLDQFQKEVTMQHRQRIDNGTLANTRMFAISKLSNYGPNEPIFPGKLWFLDDVNEIKPLQAGEVYASAFSNEHQTLQYAQQRSGVNELNLGMPQAGTPGTATAELSRVQEGNKKYDFLYKNVKRLASSVILDVACQIRQFGPRDESYYDYAENAEMVKKFFTLDPMLIRQGLLVEIAAAGQQENKLIDRQNWQQVTQMLTSYYQNSLALAMQLGNQALMQKIAEEGLTAATEAMTQILNSFDMKNINRMVLSQEEIRALIQNTGGVTAGTPNQPALPNPNAGNAQPPIPA